MSLGGGEAGGAGVLRGGLWFPWPGDVGVIEIPAASLGLLGRVLRGAGLGIPLLWSPCGACQPCRLCALTTEGFVGNCLLGEMFCLVEMMNLKVFCLIQILPYFYSLRFFGSEIVPCISLLRARVHTPAHPRPPPTGFCCGLQTIVFLLMCRVFFFFKSFWG